MNASPKRRTAKKSAGKITSAQCRNRVYLGDNLEVMRAMEGGIVDLIYLDPPFNSNRDYAVLFGKGRAKFQESSYRDTWKWGAAAESYYEEIVRDGARPRAIDECAEDLRVFMECQRRILGECPMLAYLCYMAPRLAEMRRLMKPSAYIYLHCDPGASHYLKQMMDVVFGAKNFRNEIVWCYSGGGISKQDFPRKHDVILRYRFAETAEPVFNTEYKDYKENTRQVGKHSTLSGGADIDLARGTPVTDWWPDIKTVTGWSPERTGYKTQKPLDLLRRIISVSSNAGGLVLDPFCGCGTTIEAAATMKGKRKYIGIDIERLAVNFISRRMLKAGHKVVMGELPDAPAPKTAEDMAALSLADEKVNGQFTGKYLAFQYYAVSWLDPNAWQSGSRAADDGVDGMLFVKTDSGVQKIIISVKSGRNINPEMVDALNGAVSRKKALGGVLITAAEPSMGVKKRAREAGVYKSGGKTYNKITVFSIADLMVARKISHYPQTVPYGEMTEDQLNLVFGLMQTPKSAKKQ